MVKKISYGVIGLLIGIVLFVSLVIISSQNNIDTASIITEEPHVKQSDIDNTEQDNEQIKQLEYSTYHIDNNDIYKYELNGVTHKGKENPMWYQIYKPEPEPKPEPKPEPEPKTEPKQDVEEDDKKNNNSPKIINSEDKQQKDLGGSESTQDITKNRQFKLTKKEYVMGYDKKTEMISFENTDAIEEQIKDKGVLPVDIDKYNITSAFGVRLDPFTKEKAFHIGLDIAYDIDGGNNIYSILPGTIEGVNEDENGLGNHIIVNHGAFKTTYAHMSHFAENIAIGSPIQEGTVLGYVGTTGRSTGPHLHIEFEIDGVCIDPEPFMQIILEKTQENNS